MKVVGTPIDGSKYMVRREQELARDVSAFLAIILKLLSIVAVGLTFYVIYKTRTGSVTSPYSGIDTFLTWVYLIIGLLFALALFALGHLFTMLISVFDRQELAALGILTEVASAQSPNYRDAPSSVTWQQSHWSSGMPAVVTEPEPQDLRASRERVARATQAPITAVQEPTNESLTQSSQNSPTNSKRGLWEALSKERHLFGKGDE